MSKIYVMAPAEERARIAQMHKINVALNRWDILCSHAAQIAMALMIGATTAACYIWLVYRSYVH